MESNNKKTPMADGNGLSDEVTRNPCQTKFGRHDAHKHTMSDKMCDTMGDTMGEIIQGQGNCTAAGKYNHNINFVDNQFQEENPQSDSAGAIPTDKNFHSLK